MTEEIYYRDEYGDIYPQDDLPKDRPLWELGTDPDGEKDPIYDY
jgi:hypothetical protein